MAIFGAIILLATGPVAFVWCYFVCLLGSCYNSTGFLLSIHSSPFVAFCDFM